MESKKIMIGVRKKTLAYCFFIVYSHAIYNVHIYNVQQFEGGKII